MAQLLLTGHYPYVIKKVTISSGDDLHNRSETLRYRRMKHLGSKSGCCMMTSITANWAFQRLHNAMATSNSGIVVGWILVSSTL